MARGAEAFLRRAPELLLGGCLALVLSGVVLLTLRARDVRPCARRVHLGPALVHGSPGARHAGRGIFELRRVAPCLLDERPLLAGPCALGGGLRQLGVRLCVGLVLGRERLGALVAGSRALLRGLHALGRRAPLRLIVKAVGPRALLVGGRALVEPGRAKLGDLGQDLLRVDAVLRPLVAVLRRGGELVRGGAMLGGASALLLGALEACQLRAVLAAELGLRLLVGLVHGRQRRGDVLERHVLGAHAERDLGDAAERHDASADEEPDRDRRRLAAVDEVSEQAAGPVMPPAAVPTA